MTIFIAFIVFSIIVLIHEFGHFIVAKKNGIKVEEFAIGMGPKLVGKQFGETLYSFRILPIGGFCKMLGEENSSNDDRAFSRKSVGVRMAVIAAGPLMNFFLAFVILFWFASANGFLSTTIREVHSGYPAEKAGLQVGDQVVAINGEKTHIMQDITFILSQTQNEPITLTVLHENKKKQVAITPQWDPNTNQWRIGFATQVSKGNLWSVFKHSFWQMIFFVKITVIGFVKMLTGQVARNEVAGPIGIVQMIGQSYEMGLRESIIQAIQNVALFGAMLSANLGVLNLFPIPMLDGSKLVFLALEGIRRKPIDIEKESMIHFIGFVLLMVFMVFISFNDIMRLFQ